MSVWAWLPRGDNGAALDARSLRSVLSEFDNCEVAVGAPATGTDGFRRTHDQALAAAALLRGAAGVDGRAVSYADPGVAVIAMLARDMPATRHWVHDVLGSLAVDTPNAAELRHTLRVYLQNGENCRRAGELLYLHRNSVKYRVSKAVAERPDALTSGKADLALAILACDYLGDDVLG